MSAETPGENALDPITARDWLVRLGWPLVGGLICGAALAYFAPYLLEMMGYAEGDQFQIIRRLGIVAVAGVVVALVGACVRALAHERSKPLDLFGKQLAVVAGALAYLGGVLTLPQSFLRDAGTWVGVTCLAVLTGLGLFVLARVAWRKLRARRNATMSAQSEAELLVVEGVGTEPDGDDAAQLRSSEGREVSVEPVLDVDEGDEGEPGTDLVQRHLDGKPQ